MYKQVKYCRACQSVKLKKYLDLGEQPLANCLGNNPRKYPLEVLFCEQCNLSQLSITVNPDLLYKEYPYHSSISTTFKNHCRSMAIDVKNYLTESTFTPMVIDIASNDGCLLKEFKDQGFFVTGVEPAENLAAKAEASGITTINGYWSTEVCERLTPADVITATNVFAHVDDIRSFLGAVRDKLRVYSKGIFLLEVPYLPNLIEGNQFDTIYHEHLSYFLLKPLHLLFDSCGLTIFRVDKIDIHGGSLRVWASPYVREIETSVQELLDEESQSGYHEFETYLNFSNNVEYVKNKFRQTLQEISNEGDVVMGYGASAKGINLLNICGIDPTHIHSIVDDTPDKQGKKIPGIEIPIVHFDNFDVVDPDYILLLSWNFANELIAKTPNHRERRGSYIIPIPKVEII